MDEIINSETLPGDDDVALPDGLESDSPAVSVKDVLAKALNKDFKDDESALKAVKDTFDYVGKAGKYEKPIKAIREAKGFANDEQAIKYLMDEVTTPKPEEPKIDADQYVSKEEFNRELYYKDHPEVSPYREIVEGLVKSSGKSRDEVLQLDSFRSLLEAKTAHDASEKSKSVLLSNPRLGSVTDKISQAREDLKGGDQNAASAKAVSAVLDAFDI